MKRDNQLTRRLQVGGMLTVSLGAVLVVGIGWSYFNTKPSVEAPIETADSGAELVALLKQPNDVRVDIARMNLLAGSGLGRGGEVALTNLVRELDAMTARVKAETARHVARFQRAPEEFNSSEAYFKMLCLVTVLTG